jgi:histidinol-phosphate phosphatase family protein
MRRILVIRLGAIGDLILASAPLLNLKLSFPESEIYLLTRAPLASFAISFAGVDQIIKFPQKASFKDLFQIAEQIDKIGFDMVLDLHGNFRTWYLTKHISASYKMKYEKRRWARFLAVLKEKRKVIDPAAPHSIDLYNDAVKKAGGKIFATRPVMMISGKGPVLPHDDQSLPTIAIAPGASFPTKKWPEDRFRQLAIEIGNNIPANVILLLSDFDRDMVDLAKDIPAKRLHILLDASLLDISRLLYETDLLICNDSALAHLGSAVGTPVLSIFGPTHPTLGFAPRGRNDFIMQVDEPCRPCSLHGRVLCYREERFCFTRITVADVMGKISEILRHNLRGNPALFIDRDGTLIKEKDFIDSPDDIEPEEKAIEAVRMANKARFKVIVLSNQSGVARGMFSEETVNAINDRVVQLFKQNSATIDDIFYCPHYFRGDILEYSIECNCRKPGPGMVDEACRKHNINPFHSFVIGDKLSDVKLAYVTGGRGILVRTGYGKDEETELKKPHSLIPETVAENLFAAVEYILNIRDADQG